MTRPIPADLWTAPMGTYQDLMLPSHGYWMVLKAHLTTNGMLWMYRASLS